MLFGEYYLVLMAECIQILSWLFHLKKLVLQESDKQTYVDSLDRDMDVVVRLKSREELENEDYTSPWFTHTQLSERFKVD